MSNLYVVPCANGFRFQSFGSRRVLSWLLFVLPAFQLNLVSEAAVVGGWDLSRGGPYSLSAGSNTAPLRTQLSGLFPGTTITGTSVLTPAYLSTVDTLVISAAFSDSQPITPLSTPEQTALTNFVLSGHRALILGERTGFSPLVNPTLINPFGLDINGDLVGHLPATVSNPATSPITSTPFGQVTSLATINPGWFDQLGAAHTIATLDINGQPLLAMLDAGSLGPGSGAVVLSADSDIYTQNITLIDNTFAFLIATPEPSSLILAAFGFAGLAAWSWRRRNRA